MTSQISGSSGDLDNETREMLNSFVAEAFDSLDNNEHIVEDLRNSENEESVNSIFRVFHTLKGLSGFFEMNVIHKVTHEAETLLDIIRRQNKNQTESTLTVIYQTFDFLRDLLSRINTDYTDISGDMDADDMILIIHDCIEKVKIQTETGDFNIIKENKLDDFNFNFPETSVEATIEESENIEESSFTEEIIEEATPMEFDSLISNDMLDQYMTSSVELLDTAENNLLILEKEPNNEAVIQSTFGAIHSLKGNSGFMGFSEIEEISMEMETILDCIRSKELDVEENVITVLLSNIESIRTRLDKLTKMGESEEQASNSGIIQTESISKEKHIEKSDKNQNIKSEIKSESKSDSISESKIDTNTKLEIKEAPIHDKSKSQSDTDETQTKSDKISSVVPALQRKDIRVETTKIDKLFDLVGELITIETMVRKNPDLIGLKLPNFQKSANMLNKITRELQEIAMSVRMMPLDGQFNKMKRLVRDVSLKMNKKVNLEISGQDTEMDKNVIDEIADPLVHILRNAVDHGIEPPESRISHNKNEVGIISLSARYEGNEILIVVEDDGAGLNREVLLEKARERGLVVGTGENLSDKEVYSLIFEPGFSTAEKVTDISGRGVGMDVVRKNIEKLHGTIDINSTFGKGTRITLRIPLTLAIMEAMLIRIGEATFALPILSIREAFRPQKTMITITMDGLEVVKVRQEIYPIVRLHELFDIPADNNDLIEGILIIIEARERKICLFADEIVGQQQAVIKGLSDYIGRVPGITGCMIMGDGGIGLILDVESLIDMSQRV